MWSRKMSTYVPYVHVYYSVWINLATFAWSLSAHICRELHLWCLRTVVAFLVFLHSNLRRAECRVFSRYFGPFEVSTAQPRLQLYFTWSRISGFVSDCASFARSAMLNEPKWLWVSLVNTYSTQLVDSKPNARFISGALCVCYQTPHVRINTRETRPAYYLLGPSALNRRGPVEREKSSRYLRHGSLRSTLQRLVRRLSL